MLRMLIVLIIINMCVIFLTASSMSTSTGDKRIKDLVNDISALRLSANYKDGDGERATADLLALTQFSPGDKHIKVLSSTREPKV